MKYIWYSLKKVNILYILSGIPQVEQLNVCIKWKMDGWTTCYFASFSTVFLSYHNTAMMIMKGCMQGCVEPYLWLKRFPSPARIEARPQGYKTFFMLNSFEHETLNAHKYTNIKKFIFLGSDKLRMLFFLLINVKMPTIVGILTFMSRKNLMLSWAGHEKSFITSGPGLLDQWAST